MRLLLSLFVGTCLLACAAGPKEPTETRANTPSWRWEESVDPMTDVVSLMASLQSANPIQLDFPYEGIQHPSLRILKTSKGTLGVLLSYERGQLLCSSYSPCEISVRIDGGKATSYTATTPADGTTTLVIFRDPKRFVNSLKDAKIVKISVPVFKHGTPILEYHIEGLDFARLGL